MSELTALTDALELLASSHSNTPYPSLEASISRWQHLFSYSASEASRLILAQREDPSSLVPLALWEEVREREEVNGHDWESYSHWVRSVRCAEKKKKKREGEMDGSGREFLLRLEGPFEDVEVVRRIAGLSCKPEVLEGEVEDDEERKARFCRVDGVAKERLLRWLEVEQPGFRPLFVLRSVAEKHFCAWSIAPMLGRDATMPQFRLKSEVEVPRPGQEEFPVRYFFYGTLGNEEVLRRLLRELDGEDVVYELKDAYVVGGRLAMWNGKYKALLDAPGSKEELHGGAFWVRSKEHEDVLRSYETDAYQVVRCRVFVQGEGELDGCTFRFRDVRKTT